jgi:hypothetical protein
MHGKQPLLMHLLICTKRIVGLDAASQIAAASFASSLPLLPCMR